MFGTLLTDGTITLESAMICTLVSLVCGAVTAFAASVGQRKRVSHNMMICLITVPAIVQWIIMMVNGSIGAGVAIAGAFGLIRFRSAPGTAKEITLIFLAMAAGIASGMGYAGYALLFTAVISAVTVILSVINLGGVSADSLQLKVTIPEDLDYEGIFDDVFAKYTYSHELVRIKTANMGTLYELGYVITKKKDISLKEMMDEIRCRNGNLTVICGKIAEEKDEL